MTYKENPEITKCKLPISNYSEAISEYGEANF